jgi:hypothetical protein
MKMHKKGEGKIKTPFALETSACKSIKTNCKFSKIATELGGNDDARTARKFYC